MISKIFIYLAYILLSIFSFNCESKNSDNEEKQRVIAGILINNATGGASNNSAAANLACSNSAPAFSSLSSAGVNSNCAKSGCHIGSSPQSGLDMTSYNSVLAKVTAKNGSASLLYQKINGGTMQQYTNSQITTAIFCWIQGGALP